MTRPFVDVRWIAVGTAWVVTVIMVVACASTPEGLPGGPSSQRLASRPAGSVNGAPLGYLEYLPPGYGDGAPRPLLVFLHGLDESGDGSQQSLDKLFSTGIPALIQDDAWSEERAFIVLMPQHRDDPDVPCPMPDDIQGFVDFALEQYEVDDERVYLTGLSCGAFAAWDYLAAYMDQTIAAAVPIAGDGREAVARAGCGLGRVPIWAFHGAADEVVEPDGSVDPIEQLERCVDEPVDVRLTVYPGVDHDSWSRTYDLSAGHDIYAWLLGHDRS